jgi:2-phosphosulfolactate phosphatase
LDENIIQCSLDWGVPGVRRAVARNDIIVIVDVLSFSSSVITALHYECRIFPFPESKDSEKYASELNAEATVGRRDVPRKGRFSLSPLTYLNAKPDTRIVLTSLNGGTCCEIAQDAPYLFVGALLNASAVAASISKIVEKSNMGIAIIACGEKDPDGHTGGELRTAVEDYLGAGAILSYLDLNKSVEARVCEGAFLQSQDKIDQILWDCTSGKELREIGFGEDVRYCFQLDLYECVPMFKNGYFVKYPT